MTDTTSPAAPADPPPCPACGRETERVSFISDAPGRRRVFFVAHKPVNGFRVACPLPPQN